MNKVLIEIDVSNIIRDVSIMLHKFVKEYTSGMILNEHSGYKQKDGTYAIFKTRYENLQDVVNKNFTQLPENFETKLIEASMSIIKHLIEQYIEKDSLPKGYVEKILLEKSKD